MTPDLLRVTVHPTRRLLHAAAAFGLHVRRVRRRTRVRPWAACLAPLAPGGAVLCLGPSGSGKSTRLRAAASEARRRGWVVVTPAVPSPSRSVIDQVPGPLGEAIATLCRAGLAEAKLLGRRGDELSEGERARLGLALALARAQRRRHAGGRPVLLVVDELASTLDRVTARGLCLSLRRWAARTGVRLLAATAHDDVEPWLAPARVVRLELGREGA
jgi:ABC-type ATPase with predicted acetyltransferase domain